MKIGFVVSSLLLLSGICYGQDIAPQTSSVYCITPVVSDKEVEELQEFVAFKNMSKEECSNELLKIKTTQLKKLLMVNSISWDLVLSVNSPEPLWDRVVVQITQLQLDEISKHVNLTAIRMQGSITPWGRIRNKEELGFFDLFEHSADAWDQDLLEFRHLSYQELRKLVKGTERLVRIVQIDNETVARTKPNNGEIINIEIYMSGGKVVWATRR